MSKKSNVTLTVIKPKKGWQMLNLKELIKYRELLFFLAWRDIKVRYKQTLLGVAWAIIQPFFTMVVFSLFLLLALTTSLGVSLWLSALNVEFRDVRYTIPFLTQFWLFSTPIAYPSNLLSEPWKTIYGINPMVGVVDGFRWALLGTNTPPGQAIVVSTLAALLLLVSGAFYFR